MQPPDETSALLSALVVERGKTPQLLTATTKIFLLAAAVAVLALAVAAAWRWPLPGIGSVLVATAPHAVARTSAPSVTPMPAKQVQPAAGFVASGYVVARTKSAVAAEVTGKVMELAVDEGSVLQVGDVIARLDMTLAARDVSLAESRERVAVANAESIAADLAEADRVLDRTSRLAQKGFSTTADLGRVDARRNVLKAQLRQAREQVQTSHLDVLRSTETLDKYTIRAPFSGVVVERNAQVGELVSPISSGSGQVRNAVCTLIDLDSMEINVDVNEAYLDRVRPGTRATAVLNPYPDWSIPVSVFAISPTANRDKETVEVRIALVLKDPRILPGLDVKVTFHDEAARDENLKSLSSAED